MRSELNEISLIEQWLLHQLNEDDARNFEARLLIDERFAEKVEAQRVGYRLIRHYARAQERTKLQKIYTLLMDDAVFAGQLNTIFS